MHKTLYIGADHAGYELKEALKKAMIDDAGWVIEDLTPDFMAGDDYPAVAAKLAKRVAGDSDSRGVLACGSGIGMVMAANRIKGARAFDAYDAKSVELARNDNDANIITFSGWRQKSDEAKKLLDLFLKTKVSTATRHKRRVKQLG